MTTRLASQLDVRAQLRANSQMNTDYVDALVDVCQNYKFKVTGALQTWLLTRAAADPEPPADNARSTYAQLLAALAADKACFGRGVLGVLVSVLAAHDFYVDSDLIKLIEGWTDAGGGGTPRVP